MWSFLIVALLGCPKAGQSEALRFRNELQQIDARWTLRGELGLEGAVEPLRALWAERPDHPEVSWRLVRLKIAEGLTEDDPTDALRRFAEGRALGMACLTGDEGFLLRWRQGAFSDAVGSLEASRRICLGWTALAWVRWMQLQGPEAAALDLEAIDALLGGAIDPQLDGTAVWARGLLLAIRPVWAGRDLQAAHKLLQRAIAHRPAELPQRVDWLQLTVEPLGDPAQIASARDAVLTREARTPEDRRAQERLRP
ncbi:MAG TPA: hypothetical protein ENK18_28595 [Deltaproteobacteria bacterium]|nr:hypothetical protein [Deltaproteobacteria bacterium]